MAEGIGVQRVPDVDAAKEALEAAGRTGLSDPAGNRILLHRRYAPYADGSLA